MVEAKDLLPLKIKEERMSFPVFPLSLNLCYTQSNSLAGLSTEMVQGLTYPSSPLGGGLKPLMASSHLQE